jgi:hypothetical protein
MVQRAADVDRGADWVTFRSSETSPRTCSGATYPLGAWPEPLAAAPADWWTPEQVRGDEEYGAPPSITLIEPFRLSERARALKSRK